MKQIYFANGKDPSLLRRSRKGITRAVTGTSLRLFPGITTRLAERMLCVTSPPRRKLVDLKFSVDELDVYDQKIRVFQTGTSDRSILFVHGWSGSSADFNAFYQPVLDAGFNVIAIDHVAHGASPGKVANMFLFVRAIEQVLNKNDTRITGVIAHSMGASAVVNAVHMRHGDLPVVLISPVFPFFESLYQSVDNFGISTEWVDRLLTVFENRYGRSIDEIDPKITIQKFSNPVLTIQDRQDRHIPLETNRQHFTPHISASLHETDGLGHFKILGAEEVVARSVRFVKENITHL
ncbi:MAG TPA: alpha/beta fold hydrolase [Steroidobacteraceae bacterium]|nr:alpha/beta fold hydrolase [Steroidobacteraceae bacterium]